VVFWWCFGGVLVVFWWCFGGVFGGVFGEILKGGKFKKKYFPVKLNKKQWRIHFYKKN
jgi:hypothetical protein